MNKRKTYTIELGWMSRPQSLRVIGYRAAVATAQALAGTGNGLVLLRSPDGRARAVTA
jgi:hypothetical protein